MAEYDQQQALAIRVVGQLPIGDQPGGRDEAQMIRAGLRLFDYVCGRSLDDWKTKVTTNDATKNGDE